MTTTSVAIGHVAQPPGLVWRRCPQHVTASRSTGQCSGTSCTTSSRRRGRGSAADRTSLGQSPIRWVLPARSSGLTSRINRPRGTDVGPEKLAMRRMSPSMSRAELAVRSRMESRSFFCVMRATNSRVRSSSGSDEGREDNPQMVSAQSGWHPTTCNLRSVFQLPSAAGRHGDLRSLPMIAPASWARRARCRGKSPLRQAQSAF